MADFLIILIVALCLLGIMCYYIRKKKKGEVGCGCGCSGCGSSSPRCNESKHV